MAHPHLALALVLIVLALGAGVWLAALLADPNAEIKAALGEDAGIDILRPDSAWHPADDGFGHDEPGPVEVATTHLPRRRPALYVVTRNCTHHGRHRA